IGDRGAEVELVIGQGVAGLEPTVGAKIVKLAACAGQLKALLRGVEIAGAALKEQGGKAGGAAGSGDADDAGHGPGAIKVGVRTAVDFDGIDSGGGEGAEVKLVAEIPNVDAVEEDHIVVGVSAADEERGLSAALAGLGKKSAGHEAEGINQARTQGQIERAQNCSGGARLRFRRGRAGGGDYDGLAHPCRLEDDVALDGGEAAGVEIGS